MGQFESDMLSKDSTMIDKLTSADLGEAEVWKHNRSDAYFLKKNIGQLKTKLTRQDLLLLLEAEKRLSSSIFPIMLNVDSNTTPRLDQIDEFIVEITTWSLNSEVERLNSSNETMNEVDILAILGCLIKTACQLEMNFDFHRSICLKNLFITSNGKMMILNQYIKDSHLNEMVHYIIRPVLDLGGLWEKEFWTDKEKRVKTGEKNQAVARVLESHRELVIDMMLSICLVGLCLCTGKDDQFYFDSRGKIDQKRVQESLEVDIC